MTIQLDHVVVHTPIACSKKKKKKKSPVTSTGGVATLRKLHSSLLSSWVMQADRYFSHSPCMGRPLISCIQGAEVWMLESPPNPNVDILALEDAGVRRWSPWEHMRSWGWRPHEWDECSYTKTPWWSLASCALWGPSGESWLWNGKRVITTSDQAGDWIWTWPP